MLRIFTLAFAFAAAVACAKAPPGQTGAVVAEGRGVSLTSGYLRERFAAQAPPIRQMLLHADRKKKFVDDLVRFELLAQAAEKEGLSDDPEVRFVLKKVMIERYHARYLATHPAAVSEPEIQKYYDDNKDQYSRPAFVHLELVFLASGLGAPDRDAKGREAEKLLKALQAGAKTQPGALANLAKERSDDAATRHLGGDLGSRTRQELAAVYGKELAEAAFTVEAGQFVPSPVETPDGFYLLRVVERQEAQLRKLDDVRARIVSVLADERGDTEYEAHVKKILDEAQVRLNEAELEKVAADTKGNL